MVIPSPSYSNPPSRLFHFLQIRLFFSWMWFTKLFALIWHKAVWTGHPVRLSHSWRLACKLLHYSRRPLLLGMSCRSRNLSSYVEPKTRLCRIRLTCRSVIWALFRHHNDRGVHAGHPLLHWQHTKRVLFDRRGRTFSLTGARGSLCLSFPLQLYSRNSKIGFFSFG